MELDNNYVNLAAFLIVIVLGGFLFISFVLPIISGILILFFSLFFSVLAFPFNFIKEIFKFLIPHKTTLNVMEYLKNDKSGINSSLSSEEIVKKLQALKSDSPAPFGELKEKEINLVPVINNKKLIEKNYVDDNWRLVGLVRHNTNCDYFKSKNAVSCGSRDGVPCKICGG